MSVLAQVFKNLTVGGSLQMTTKIVLNSVYPVQNRSKSIFSTLPKAGRGNSFRRIVHFEKEYTVKPLKTTNLAGRDPVTGRKVVNRLGGGIKHKYHWIKFQRDGPEEGEPQLEKVLRILKCGCRTAHVALVAVGDQMKYILATENMKPGDMIRTSKFIPKNPVQPNEGDAYPLGALPAGTIVHNVQLHPDNETTIIHSAGSFAVVKRILNDKVVVQLPSKQEYALDPRCMVTVGRLSNVIHSSIPVGSPQRLRELGYRPRSGWWQRKTGRFGRKIRKIPPVKVYEGPKPKEHVIRLKHQKLKLPDHVV